MPKKPVRLATPSRNVSIFYMLVNTVTWGAALPIVKPALEFVTPYQFLLYRYLFAAIFSIPLLFYYLPKIRHKLSTIIKISLHEVLGTTIALSLLYIGLSKTTVLEASFIAATTPLFITIGGMLFLKEKHLKREWLGLTLAVYGTILLTLEPIILKKTTLHGFSVVGNMLVFAQNLAIAAYFILAKKFYKDIPKLFVTTISYFVGIVSFFIIVMVTTPLGSLPAFQDQKRVEPVLYQLVVHTLTDIPVHLSHPAVLLAVLYMATFGSIIGLTAYIKGQDGLSASEAGLFTYLQPLVFIPLSILWLSETVNYVMIFAVLVISAGVWMAEYRPRQNKR